MKKSYKQIVEKIYYNNIKQYIAASTLKKLISKIRYYNAKGVSPKIRLLLSDANSRYKQLYNINTYSQLIDSIYKLRLDASLYIRPGALIIDNDISSLNNLIVKAADKLKDIYIEYDSYFGRLIDNVSSLAYYPNIYLEIPISRIGLIDDSSISRMKGFSVYANDINVNELIDRLSPYSDKNIVIAEWDIKRINSIMRADHNYAIEVLYGPASTLLNSYNLQLSMPYGRYWQYYIDKYKISSIKAKVMKKIFKL
ncbi:MAG: hypothetical protein ARM1_0582 [Candidatus Micrarchaeota archaeon]|nr:MAG: hypothetical protein ARM1_0582 [Candidatus Micrarchaeota archaeon]